MTRLLGPPLTDAERIVMFEQARALLGLKWRHQGLSERRGVDCRGYAWIVLAKTLRITRGEILQAPRKDYPREPPQRRRELRAGMIEWLGEPVSGDPRPGDIITMRWVGGEHHVALVTPHPLRGIGLIHADNTATGGARVVEHGVDYVWQRRLVEVFRP